MLKINVARVVSKERRKQMARWYKNRPEADKLAAQARDTERKRKMRETWTEEEKKMANEATKDWRKSNPIAAWSEKAQEAYRSNARKFQIKRRLKFKNLVLDHYGRFCSCCGETEEFFLTVDHVNNDGAAHRKIVRAGLIHQYIVEHDYPDTFRILCYNCNCGRARNKGVCPHIKNRQTNAAMLQSNEASIIDSIM